MIKRLLNNSWRFYLFTNDNCFYCFDCFSSKIFSINENLYNLLLQKNYKSIKNQYSKFFKQVINTKPFHVKEQKSNDCYVTINFSNKCNLNCKYCYRQKLDTSSLSEENLAEIIQYIKNVYDPKANNYHFQLCYTSESSLDINKLKYFDYLIGQYEGYFFSEKELSNKKCKYIINNLPREIITKYSYKNSYTEILNGILQNENLWEYFDYSNHEYLTSILSKTTDFSFSRKVMVNRQIINNAFQKFNLYRTIKYMSLSFMTNATNISNEYITFLKQNFIESIVVSLDGPEEVHDKNRIYHDEKGSYNDVIKGIRKLQDNGIDVTVSAVITPDYPDLNKIADHFISLGFSKMIFNLSRGRKESTIFTEKSINELLESIYQIYEEVYTDFLNHKISKKLTLLKDTFVFSYLKQIYYRTYVTNRCEWGSTLVIDSKGNLYHCNSTIGYQKDCLGNYRDYKKRKKLLQKPNINDSERCSNCYAKFLCGGTCYAEQIFENTQNIVNECYFHKNLINKAFSLYSQLKTESLLESFMNALN